MRLPRPGGQFAKVRRAQAPKPVSWLKTAGAQGRLVCRGCHSRPSGSPVPAPAAPGPAAARGPGLCRNSPTEQPCPSTPWQALQPYGAGTLPSSASGPPPTPGPVHVHQRPAFLGAGHRAQEPRCVSARRLPSWRI